MLDTELKLKQQAEWLQHVTLTREQFNTLIAKKLDRNKQLSSNGKKSQSGNLIA